MPLDAPADKEIIRVVGYPRSGNAWGARLLGRLLNAPVYGPAYGQRASLASDVQGAATSNYAIVQAHAWLDAKWQARSPMGDAPLMPWGEHERIVHIVRDPRGVLASIVPFFELADYAEGLVRMQRTGGLLGPCFPGWAEYVQAWEGTNCPYQVVMVRYCDLSADALLRAMLALCLPADIEAIQAALAAEEITAKKAAIAAAPERAFPHGRAAQLHHLRQGQVGSWRHELPPDIVKQATQIWADLLARHGWEV